MPGGRTVNAGGEVGLPPAPSGEQFEIARGEQRATIVEVGGGIREYRVGDRDVLDPYPRDAICDGAHGAPLIPWPNRLRDGSYAFEGSDHQLALTEPENHNAIHGLLRWRNWRVLERADDRVVVGIRLHPMTGWPFPLDVSIAYALGEEGLSVETRATNIGDTACPFACGQHPYLSPGREETVDGCTLELRARTRILTDSERQLPAGVEPVEGTDYDFRSPRRIGSLELDCAFLDLDRDQDGLARVRLACRDDRTVEMWADRTYPVIQAFTADTLAPSRRRRGLAVEPMSAPANALQTGEMIVRLEPGEEYVGRWGVGLL
jgi:aldose 1-epimerase